MHYEIFLLIPALVFAVILFSRKYKRRKFKELVHGLGPDHDAEEPRDEPADEPPDTGDIKW